MFQTSRSGLRPSVRPNQASFTTNIDRSHDNWMVTSLTVASVLEIAPRVGTNWGCTIEQLKAETDETVLSPNMGGLTI